MTAKHQHSQKFFLCYVCVFTGFIITDAVSEPQSILCLSLCNSSSFWLMMLSLVCIGDIHSFVVQRLTQDRFFLSTFKENAFIIAFFGEAVDVQLAFSGLSEIQKCYMKVCAFLLFCMNV